MTGVFAEWQPVYAEHNIPTFPCRPDKRPAVTNYGKFGLPASKEIASSSGANAFGFMCGKRSAVTVLDVDIADERILADALDRHGKTPIIARSASGHFQAWYRHNGERRMIRPRRDVPIDILGGGYVVAPPSRVERGRYQFIEGSLDELSNLPALQNIPEALVREDAPELANMREGDGRNDALFRLLGREAHHCDDFEQLLDRARTKNEQLGRPMQDIEVLKVTQSVWKMQCEGRNRFGQFGAYVPLNLVRSLARCNPDALALYNVLKAENGPNSIFPIANAMAHTTVNYGWRRFADARKVIVREGLVIQVSPDRYHRPALYRWPRGQGEGVR